MIGKLLIVALMIFAIWLYFKFFKLYKVRNINFVDGTLGSGKSFLSVSLAVRTYKRELRRYKIKKWLLNDLSKVPMFNKKFNLKKKVEELEEPELYCNIPLDSEKVKYSLLTIDMILRKEFRPAYKSVVLIDDFGLFADQMQFKDAETNERLLEFFKLFRHETRGGYFFSNSQTLNDLHYSLKYTMTDYLYIHHKIRLPFVSILKVQELMYIADKQGNQQVTSINEGDFTENLKTMVILNKYFKYYDTYCYSILTDNLAVWRNRPRTSRKNKTLKAKKILTIKQKHYYYENLEKEAQK